MICIHNILVVLFSDVISQAVEKKGVLFWLLVNELKLHNCDWPRPIRACQNTLTNSINHDLDF